MTQEPTTLKWSHVLITCIAWLVLIGAIYGNISARLAMVESNQQNNVHKEEFGEMREDITRRLQRIENKLDHERK